MTTDALKMIQNLNMMLKAFRNGFEYIPMIPD